MYSFYFWTISIQRYVWVTRSERPNPKPLIERVRRTKSSRPEGLPTRSQDLEGPNSVIFLNRELSLLISSETIILINIITIEPPPPPP